MNVYKSLLFAIPISLLLWALLIGAIAFGIRTYNGTTREPTTIPYGEFTGFDTQNEKDEHERLLRYHGADGAFYEHGEWWFVRNGRACRLWNPDINQEWTN